MKEIEFIILNKKTFYAKNTGISLPSLDVQKAKYH